MKKNRFLLYLIIICTFQNCCYLSDCNDEFVIEPANYYEPITLSRNDFENSVKITEPKTIEVSGKIYLKNNLLLINEVHKGFHLYDNSYPSAPLPIKFIEAPGATDVAIRDNIMYINQATDLIAVEYTPSTQEISVTKRVVNIFPELRSPDGQIAYGLTEDTIVIDWKLIN